MNSLTRVPAISVEGEIDLFSIFLRLWRRKMLIVSVAVMSAAFGAIYAYRVTPEYQVVTVLRPAALNGLDALNRSRIYSLPPAEALKRVGAALDSYEARLEFFSSRPELVGVYQRSGSSLEQAFEFFNTEALKLVQSDPKKSIC